VCLPACVRACVRACVCVCGERERKERFLKSSLLKIHSMFYSAPPLDLPPGTASTVPCPLFLCHQLLFLCLFFSLPFFSSSLLFYLCLSRWKYLILCMRTIATSSLHIAVRVRPHPFLINAMIRNPFNLIS
jgi:hypothetical protein